MNAQYQTDQPQAPQYPREPAPTPQSVSGLARLDFLYEPSVDAATSVRGAVELNSSGTALLLQNANAVAVLKPGANPQFVRDTVRRRTAQHADEARRLFVASWLAWIMIALELVVGLVVVTSVMKVIHPAAFVVALLLSILVAGYIQWLASSSLRRWRTGSALPVDDVLLVATTEPSTKVAQAADARALTGHDVHWAWTVLSVADRDRLAALLLSSPGDDAALVRANALAVLAGIGDSARRAAGN